MLTASLQRAYSESVQATKLGRVCDFILFYVRTCGARTVEGAGKRCVSEVLFSTPPRHAVDLEIPVESQLRHMTDSTPHCFPLLKLSSSNFLGRGIPREGGGGNQLLRALPSLSAR